MPVRMLPPTGGPAVEIPDGDVQVFADRGYTVQTNAQRAAAAVDAARSDYYSSPQAKVATVGLGIARSMSGGASDFAIREIGGDDARATAEALRSENPYLSAGAELVGSMNPAGAGGLAAKAGSKVSAAIGEGSIAARLIGAGAGAGTEGILLGAQQGASEVALSAKPIEFEHAASTIGSSALFGGAVGAGAGVAGKTLELGLAKAKSALDKVAEKGVSTGAEVAQDLAGLDKKGLRAAEQTELDAIEAARVPKRAEVADEIRAFRQDLKDNKLWLATKDSEIPQVRIIGKRTLKADKALDNLLDDPKLLAESPKSALKQLRVQEAALDDLVTKHGDALRVAFSKDTSGTRLAALDYASTALEKNRALQAKITELSSVPKSARLDQITGAMDALNTPKPAARASFGDALGGAALGHAVGMAAGIPYLGQAVLAGKAVAGVVKKLGVNTAQAAERGAKAVQTFLDVTKKVTPHVPVVATKVLGGVRYGASSKQDDKPTLASLYHARANEIRSQVTIGETGELEMHPAAREQMAAALAPIRAVNPVLADRIETNKARAIAFLASKLPKKPDIAGMQLGPDTWKPSDMEMRQFARYVATVEDPHAAFERAASGTVSPEDAEALKNVYPEMHADFTAQVIAQVQTLKKPLPYARRLSLSILTGLAVDPALDPRILASLQSTFTNEAGTEGGVQAPRAQPAFGSVSKPEPTPAQRRAG